jgi:hypothetical protein
MSYNISSKFYSRGRSSIAFATNKATNKSQNSHIPSSHHGINPRSLPARFPHFESSNRRRRDNPLPKMPRPHVLPHHRRLPEGHEFFTGSGARPMESWSWLCQVTDTSGMPIFDLCHHGWVMKNLWTVERLGGEHVADSKKVKGTRRSNWIWLLVLRRGKGCRKW